jgi:hypothetical protein
MFAAFNLQADTIGLLLILAAAFAYAFASDIRNGERPKVTLRVMLVTTAVISVVLSLMAYAARN